MAHCRLPDLPGRPPLGGRVLSHDQVEAVLMRRAGWEVRAGGGGREFRGEPANPVGLRKARPALVPGQLAVRTFGRPAGSALDGAPPALACDPDVCLGTGLDPVLAGKLRPGHRRGELACCSGRRRAVGTLSRHTAALGALMPLAATMTLVFAPKLAGVAQVLLVPRLRRCYGGACASRPLPWWSSSSRSSWRRSWRSGRASSSWACSPGGRSAGRRSCAIRAPRGGARRCGAFGRRPCLAWSWGLQLDLASIGPNLGDACSRPAAARRALRRGHFLDRATRGAGTPRDLRRARGGRAATGRGGGRSCGWRGTGQPARWRSSKSCGDAGSAAGRLTAITRLAEPDIGSRGIDALVDRAPAKAAVERERLAVADQALELQRAVGFSPGGGQQLPADPASAPRRRDVEKAVPTRQSETNPTTAGPAAATNRSSPSTRAMNLRSSPRRRTRFDFLLAAREQLGTVLQITAQCRAHDRDRPRTHSPGARTGA